MLGAFVSEGFVSERPRRLQQHRPGVLRAGRAAYDTAVGGPRYVLHPHRSRRGSVLHELDVQDLAALRAQRARRDRRPVEAPKRVARSSSGPGRPPASGSSSRPCSPATARARRLPARPRCRSPTRTPQRAARQGRPEACCSSSASCRKRYRHAAGECKVVHHRPPRRPAVRHAGSASSVPSRRSSPASSARRPHATRAMASDHVPGLGAFLRAPRHDRSTQAAAGSAARPRPDRALGARAGEEILAHVDEPDARDDRRGADRRALLLRRRRRRRRRRRAAGLQRPGRLRQTTRSSPTASSATTPSAGSPRSRCRCSPTSTRRPSTSSTTTTAAPRSRRSSRAACPNLLINGSAGIAVGMATNIPPHNLREVAAGATWALDHPEASEEETLEALMARIKGPDFPTGGPHRRHRRHRVGLPHRPRVGPDARRGGGRGGHQGPHHPRRHRAALPGQPRQPHRVDRDDGPRGPHHRHRRDQRRVSPTASAGASSSRCAATPSRRSC